MLKTKILALTVAAVCIIPLFAACGGGEDKQTECVEHTWNDGEVTSQPTCGEGGVKTYTCTVCGETKTASYGEGTGNHTYDGNTCTVCGYIDMSGLTKEEAISQYGYYHDDVDGSNTVNLNDKIYFGSYPQERVQDATLLSALNDKLGESDWVSYGYYAESEQGDLMLYQDVTENDVKYRAVKIDECRPSRSDGTTESSYVSENGYTAGNVYWFEFTPIEWRVLGYANGEAMLNAVKCIDSQAFNNVFVKDGTNYYGDSGKTVYLNDWESSDIRAWLNADFYNSAFSSSEQGKIAAQTLDNVNTGFDATSRYNADQKSTTDKVYLLSYTDILNAGYGFPVDKVKGTGHASIEDLTVCKTGTDYALCQGLRTSAQSANASGEPCSLWILRSAGGVSFSVSVVNKYGLLSKSNTASFNDEDALAVSTNSGISPAINIKIGK